MRTTDSIWSTERLDLPPSMLGPGLGEITEEVVHDVTFTASGHRIIAGEVDAATRPATCWHHRMAASRRDAPSHPCGHGGTLLAMTTPTHGLLSPTQRHIVRFSTRGKRWTIVSGPQGAGKTYAALVGFLLWMSRHAGCNLGLLTKTKKQLLALLQDDIHRLIGARSINNDGHIEIPSAVGASNRLWTFYGTDRRAEPRIRGYNFSGFFIDEVTTLPFELLGAANARVRVGPDPHIVCCTNPDGPLHPFKLQYLDQIDRLGEAISTQLSDNPALPDGYRESLEQHYTGHMLRRMVHGEWAAATGLVYPLAHEACHNDAPFDTFGAYDISVDVGSASVTHALLAARTTDGHTWIIDEWRHDHTHGQMTDAACIRAIGAQWGHLPIANWIVDPAARSFRREVQRQYHDAVVAKAANDWLEGVEEVNAWLSTGHLHFYAPRLPHLLAEIGGLVWNPDRALIGEDVPIKTSDHGTDALRYVILTRAIDETGGRAAWELQRNKLVE